MSQAALTGIRIADFTWAWAGPYCTKLMADMGAEVIKIETRKRPDIGRVLGPFPQNKRGLNRSARFNKRNRNKLGITLDLTRPRGVELAKEIIKISDVVTENYTPRVMKNFGLDYEVLKEMKPGIIYLGLSGFGASGPYQDYVSYGPLWAALCGMAYLTGYGGGPPVAIGVALGDPIAGLNAAVAVLAALHYRSRTGKGQYIDLAQGEAITSLMGQPLMDYVMNRRVQARQGNRHQAMAPHNFYPCKGGDAWVAIAVSRQEEWKGLCDAMGNPSWTREARFADQMSRWNNQEELDRLIGKWTINYGHYEVTEILQKVGVAATPVLNGEELVNDPHLNARGFLVEVEHPEVGKRIMPGVSTPLSETPGRINRSAPLLGEHNEYVLGELLGISASEINKLVEEKVVY